MLNSSMHAFHIFFYVMWYALNAIHPQHYLYCDKMKKGKRSRRRRKRWRNCIKSCEIKVIVTNTEIYLISCLTSVCFEFLSFVFFPFSFSFERIITIKNPTKKTVDNRLVKSFRFAFVEKNGQKIERNNKPDVWKITTIIKKKEYTLLFHYAYVITIWVLKWK